MLNESTIFINEVPASIFEPQFLRDNSNVVILDLLAIN